MEDFKTLPLKAKSIEIVRWVIFIPLSLIGGVIARLIINMFFFVQNCGDIKNSIHPFSMYNTNGHPFWESLDILGYFIVSYSVYGFASVVVANKVAPRHKYYASLFIVCLWALFTVFSLFVTITSSANWIDFIAIVIILISSLITAILMK